MQDMLNQRRSVLPGDDTRSEPCLARVDCDEACWQQERKLFFVTGNLCWVKKWVSVFMQQEGA